jgi:hypothetical protein
MGVVRWGTPMSMMFDVRVEVAEDIELLRAAECAVYDPDTRAAIVKLRKSVEAAAMAEADPRLLPDRDPLEG